MPWPGPCHLSALVFIVRQNADQKLRICGKMRLVQHPTMLAEALPCVKAAARGVLPGAFDADQAAISLVNSVYCLSA